MKGTILAVSIPQHSADVLADSKSEEEELPSLSGEIACLQELLHAQEDEVIVLRARLTDTDEELLKAKEKI